MQVIIGTKIGMTQIIGADGMVTPVTILQAGPCTVTQIKTVETDGYNAVQVGYGSRKNLSKSVAGHVKKAGDEVSPQVLREFRVETVPEEMKLGDVISVESFHIGDKVAATGTSKGKGFAGTVKRHNFNEARNTHGFKGNIRTVGSIGSGYPQKVWKGKKMPGRMGHEQVTVKNLEVAYLDADRNLIGLKGAVPGPKKGLISIVSGKGAIEITHPKAVTEKPTAAQNAAAEVTEKPAEAAGTTEKATEAAKATEKPAAEGKE